MHDVTQILQRLEQEGEAAAAQELLPLVYDELRRLASHHLAAERSNHTLSPTALVHEAYVKLVGTSPDDRNWKSRSHFFAAAAQAMRRILVDSARKRLAIKRGGQAKRSLLDSGVVAPSDDANLLALDFALARLQQQRPDLAQLVSLRYFAGLTMAQAAAALDLPLRTAERHWTYARAWLLQEIAGEP